MSEETGLDIAGVGQIAKAIPQKAWVQLVDTACQTFRDAIAPFTATTSGIGRLIEAKFDRLVEAEKVLAAENVAKTAAKVARSRRLPSGKAKARIVVAAIEASGRETDPVMRELWSNLLAQEITDGTVHPEFPLVLSRLSSRDAQLLARIAEREKDKSKALKAAVRSLASSISILGLSIGRLDREESSFTHEHLEHLMLIRASDGVWSLTSTGRAFIGAVSDAQTEGEV